MYCNEKPTRQGTRDAAKPTCTCTTASWAMQLLSVTLQRGNAEMYRRSGLVISREQRLRYDAGFAVPVLMS